MFVQLDSSTLQSGRVQNVGKIWMSTCMKQTHLFGRHTHLYCTWQILDDCPLGQYKIMIMAHIRLAGFGSRLQERKIAPWHCSRTLNQSSSSQWRKIVPQEPTPTVMERPSCQPSRGWHGEASMLPQVSILPSIVSNETTSWPKWKSGRTNQRFQASKLYLKLMMTQGAIHKLCSSLEPSLLSLVTKKQLSLKKSSALASDSMTKESGTIWHRSNCKEKRSWLNSTHTTSTFQQLVGMIWTPELSALTSLKVNQKTNLSTISAQFVHWRTFLAAN